MNHQRMSLSDILHRISQLKWLFLLAEVILIIYALVVIPPNLISIIGVIIFITGIQMGLDSLADVEKTSYKSLARY